jgi:hypothetical protein
LAVYRFFVVSFLCLSPTSAVPLTRLFPCSTQKLSLFAGSALNKLTEVAKVGAKTVADGTRDLGKKVQSGEVTHKLSASLHTVTNSVTQTVTDPALLSKVSHTATSFWARASSTAGTLWSSAAAGATKLVGEINNVPSDGSRGSAAFGSAYGATAGLSSTPRVPASAGGGRTGPSLRPFRNFDEEEDEDDGIHVGDHPRGRNDSGSARGSVNLGLPPHRASLLHTAPVDEDDDASWLASQVAAAAVNIRPAPLGSGRPASNASTPAGGGGAGLDEWSTAEFEEVGLGSPAGSKAGGVAIALDTPTSERGAGMASHHSSTTSLVGASSLGASLADAPTQPRGAKAVDVSLEDEDAEDGWGAGNAVFAAPATTANASATNAASKTKAAAAADEELDFFSQFGVK